MLREGLVDPRDPATMGWSSACLDGAELLLKKTQLLLRRKRSRRYRDPSSMPAEARRRPESLDGVKRPRHLITICAWCNKIRNNEGAWRQPQAEVQAHRNPEFTHGICPVCAEQSYSVFHYRDAGLHATPLGHELSNWELAGSRGATVGAGA